MFDLFLPFLVGAALGVEPDRGPSAEPAPASGAVAALPPLDQGSGDDMIDTRTPEPQVPTGRFTTAVEVRPILGMTKSNWVAVREYEGQDLVYFTHLMSWRCGLWDIRYGINGAPADNVVSMEPCHADYQQPNVMIDLENFRPYVSYPAGSVQSVAVEIVYDDGKSDFAQFNRSAVLIP